MVPYGSGKNALVNFSRSKSVRVIAGFQAYTKKVAISLEVGFQFREETKTNFLLNVLRDWMP